MAKTKIKVYVMNEPSEKAIKECAEVMLKIAKRRSEENNPMSKIS